MAEQRAEKPKSHKPKAAKGDHRPPKSHKTERSPMKPGAAPKPKSDGSTKPKAKAVWKKDAAPTDASRKAKGGKPSKHRADQKPEGKSYQRAADPSKRFTPPNKIGKQGSKTKGGATTPRRGK